MRKLLYFLCGALLVVCLGCATGGGGDIETGEDAGTRMTRTDDDGFERELGPAEIAYQTAQQFLSTGNYNEAIRHLQNATMHKPSYLAAWSELGKTLTKIKDFQGGIDAFDKALEIEPGNEGIIASIGYNYLNLENYTKAAEYYNMLPTESYDRNVHLGFIAQKQSDVDGAIQYYETALAARPDDALTIGTLADLYKDKGDEDRQLEYLERAIEIAPDNYRTKIQLGATYMRRKEFDKAVAIYEDIVNQYPDEAAYHQNLGLALSQTERRAEAPASLERAIGIRGDNPQMFAYLSQIYNELGKPNDAIRTVQAGLKLGGEKAFLYYQWGVAHEKLNQFDEAIEKFEKVVAYKDPVWSGPAGKQIPRQEKLKIRWERLQEQKEYEN